VKRQLFSDQNSSNTFQVPPGTSSVRYRVYGGVGGGVGESGSGGAGGYVEGSIPVDGETTLNVYVGQNGGNGEKIVDVGEARNRLLTSETKGTGGRGGCVPYNGVKCGGNGGDAYLNKVFYDISEIATYTNGAGGGGAPTVLTDSTDQIMLVAGGGGGESTQSGGGGGAGGGKGSDASSVFHGDAAGEDPNEPNAGEDADVTTKNLGGNADEPGDTFVRSGLPAADSTGTSREGVRAPRSNWLRSHREYVQTRGKWWLKVKSPKPMAFVSGLPHRLTASNRPVVSGLNLMSSADSQNRAVV
jgi:hypothetical protein